MSVIYGLLTLELDIIQIYHHIFGNWFYKYACYGSQELETLYMLATVVSQNFKLRNSLFDSWKSNLTRIIFSCTVFIYVMMVVLFLHRVLTVHGSDDSVVRVEEALGFAKVIPNHKLHIIEGADHRFSEHRDDLASIVLSFIKEHLNQWCNIKV